MNKKLFPVMLAGLCFTGCSVMHFKNGETKSEGHVQEKWHHNLAYSLWEVSPAVNLASLCPEKEWSVVTTKETFLSGLAGSADGVVTGALLAGLNVDIWDPQMIEWNCGGAKAGGSVSSAPADSAK